MGLGNGIFYRKNFSKILFYFFISLFFIVSVSNSETLFKSQYLPYELTWCIEKNKCLRLEVANTPYERKIGLMNRPILIENTAMIFLFDKPTDQKFWMFNTLNPLDIVFIKNNKIVHLEKNMPVCKKQPCRLYGPNQLYDYAIELNSGDIQRLKINISDEVQLNVL